MPTKPKKERGLRITTPATEKTGMPGRPKGTRLRRKFSQTKLGFMLKYECPFEYAMIMKTVPPGGVEQPEIEHIEAICSISTDPSFQKNKFKRYLEEYRENGIHAARAKNPTPERLQYYRDLRNNKIKQYGAAHRVELKHILK